MERLDLLLSPFKVKNLTLKNRLVMAPMWSNHSDPVTRFTPQLVDHYVRRAKGDVALLIQEATAVRQEGLCAERYLGLWDDSFIPGWKNLVDAVHENGAKMAVQISHGGRQTTPQINGGLPRVAPSAYVDHVYPEPAHVLTIPEIVAIEDAFAAAAERAVRAGYDVVEIHAGHGYLLNQFMSPLYNTRQDEYGGTFENRLRFPLEVIAKVRRAVGPDYPLFIRISADEYRPGGYTLAGAQLMVPDFIAAGIDVIHVSASSPPAGPFSTAPNSFPRGNLLPLAAGIKQVSTVPVIAAGRIVDIRMAEEALRAGRADLIAMGRGLLADPDVLLKVRAGRLDDIRQCIGCSQGCRLRPMQCLVNVETGHDRQMQFGPATQPKKVVVVGGGPGGLETARVATLRSHQVTLFELSDRLGGRLRIGALTPHKQEVGVFVDYLDRQVHKLGVDLRLGQQATASAIGALNPDVVVVATGGQPVIPERPGVERPHVVVAEDVLAKNPVIGEQVIVMGAGMTGCEVAELLAERGKQVTIVTRVATADAICVDMPVVPRRLLMQRLDKLRVAILTGTYLEEIGERDVVIRNGDERTSLRADTVVLAQGYRPRRDLAGDLATLGIPVHVIGDAAQCRTALEAVREGSALARQL